MESIADIFARRDAEQKAKKRRRNHVAVWDAWGAGNDADLANDPLITLSSTTIAENAADNSVVGALSVSNPEGTYVFTITADPDNKFAISGSNLIIDELLDYETATSHSVTIEANPDVGATISRTFTITVTDVAIGALSGFAWAANPSSDASPGFDINLPENAAAGMELVGQYGGSNTEWLRYELTGADIIADSITVSGGSDIPSGTHTARFRLEDGSEFSAWLTVPDIEIEEAFVKVALEGGLLYPGGWLAKAVTLATAATLDAAAKKMAMIGRVYWNGRPGSAKTISAAGGGSISFAAGTVTFANGGSTLEIGLQDVSAATNTPDGTFDVSRVLTGNAVSPIATAAGNTIAMTGGSGSKSLAHGDLVAVVFDMTARAGSDSVIINGVQQAAGMLQSGGIPGVNTHNGTLWGTTYPALPNIVLTADDGTIGTIDGAGVFATASPGSESFSDSTNPDERGHIFRTNFDCDVDGVWLHIRPDADFTVSLYSDPLGTPASVASVAQVAEVFGGTGVFRIGFLPFSAPVSLTANTDYCIAVKANETTNILLSRTQLNDEAHRALLLGGTTVKKATRNNGSGAFSAESPALTYYNGLALRISHIHTPV